MLTSLQSQASATDDENISTDGADGADADGTDTDIEVLDGERFKIETSVFSTAFKEAFKTDSLGNIHPDVCSELSCLWR